MIYCGNCGKEKSYVRGVPRLSSNKTVRIHDRLEQEVTLDLLCLNCNRNDNLVVESVAVTLKDLTPEQVQFVKDAVDEMNTDERDGV